MLSGVKCKTSRRLRARIKLIRYLWTCLKIRHTYKRPATFQERFAKMLEHEQKHFSLGEFYGTSE